MDKCTVIMIDHGDYIERQEGNMLNTLLFPAQKDILKFGPIFQPPHLLKNHTKRDTPRLARTVIIDFEIIIIC